MLKILNFVEPFTCRWQFSCETKQSNGAEAQVDSQGIDGFQCQCFCSLTLTQNDRYFLEELE